MVERLNETRAGEAEVSKVLRVVDELAVQLRVRGRENNAFLG